MLVVLATILLAGVAAQNSTFVAKLKNPGIGITTLPCSELEFVGEDVVVMRLCNDMVALYDSDLFETVEEDAQMEIPMTEEEAEAAVLYPPKWGIDRAFGALDGKYLNDSRAGAGTVYYVVDTGVQGDLAEFGGRVQPGRSYVPSDKEEANTDCHGHGTHVASVAAGNTWGVAKAAAIVPVRVLDCNGRGFVSDIVRGLQYVIDDALAHGKPSVVGMSLGGSKSVVLNDMVAKAVARNLAVTVAAGNSAIDACRMSPASAKQAITVCATDIADEKAYFSNYGTCVDICAPGRAIGGAWPTAAYKQLSGTSMAQPIVAGAALVVRSVQPEMDAQEVHKVVLDIARKGLLRLPQDTPNLLVNVEYEKRKRRCGVNRKYGQCQKYDWCEWFPRKQCVGVTKTCTKARRWKRCKRIPTCRWVPRGCRNA